MYGYRRPNVNQFFNGEIRRRFLCDKHVKPSDLELELKQMSFTARYWKLAKDYWYLLFPVHMFSSAGIFGSLYLLARSGLDINVLLERAEKIGIPKKVLHALKESELGNFAVAALLYKIITPVRYMVTAAGTLWTIKIGVRKGWIKPVPSKSQIKTMFQENVSKDKLKTMIQDRLKESKNKKQRTEK
ncbi:uncharacterized protein B4U80_07935 [Leptotrombidium deliense]|uniref:DUF1279 domain-containing protein n=1 Tax=Leptotrombidium deliense TaxID=299467 RepID=A0A443SEX3_9ACAR|nr:uncharacterized protein B4U80_07935 [Leptotrombidium deliense]